MKTKTAWILSALFSSCAFLASFSILYRHHKLTQPYEPKEATKVITKKQVNLFLQKNAEVRGAVFSAQHLIPTGIIIKSLAIKDQNIIVLSGSIWQTYTSENLNLKKEMVILNASKAEITPTYETQTERGKVYGFDFQAEMLAPFDYTHFPLDRQHINLELAHSSLIKPVILVPDFASWKSDDMRKIGIDPDLNPSGLVIENSFFSYTLEKSVTTKGIDDYVFSDDFPILNYNINVKREALNLLILVFVPVLTILLLSFAFLLMFRRLFSRPHSYISINAAILFALIVSHQRLRDLIPSNVPSYPEYAYFLSYLIILFNIMLAVRYVKTLGSTETIKSMPRETFFLRTIYWPFISTIFLIITFVFFSS